ncbi:MAG TPA: hypothetical protein ENK18_27185, partial [Deltaproteobacteria bacterium]|nr:hypothetical protein [Deltaproteobacteria bacterium]
MLERTSTHLPARLPLTPLGGLLALLVAPGASATPLDPLGFGLIQSSWDPSGAITIDTDALTLSEGGLVLTGELSPDGIAVFTFGEVVIDEIVTVTGARPVAILSRGDLVLDAEIVAGAWWRAPGPGGHPGGASQG